MGEFTMDITPVGMQTTEGAKRVSKALEAWQHAQAEAANGPLHFLEEHGDTLRLLAANGDDFTEDLSELRDKLATMKARQEDFLRAIAGR